MAIFPSYFHEREGLNWTSERVSFKTEFRLKQIKFH